MSILRSRGQVIGDTVMLDHDPLRFSCRSRGIDDVGKLVSCHGLIRPPVIGTGAQIINIQGLWILGPPFFTCDQKPGLAVSQDLFHPPLGILEIEGNIGAAGFKNSQHGHQDAPGPGQEEGYPFLRGQTQSQQGIGNPIGLGVQLTVAVVTFTGDEGGGFG